MAGAERRRSMVGSLALFFVGTIIVLLMLSVGWAFAYKYVDPPATYLTLRDDIAGRHVEQNWVPLGFITPAMPRAVIGAEDARFCAHKGFDLGAIEDALARNAKKTGTLRGGSTISQQVAKNAFLWPGRSYLRKGLEAYFTVLIEALWGKRRIMEVYLNVAELGPGIYGVDAAARHYFDVGADTMTPRQAARLATILPQPIKRNAADLKGTDRRHARAIEKRIRVVRRGAIDACLAAA